MHSTHYFDVRISLNKKTLENSIKDFKLETIEEIDFYYYPCLITVQLTFESGISHDILNDAILKVKSFLSNL